MQHGLCDIRVPVILGLHLRAARISCTFGNTAICNVGAGLCHPKLHRRKGAEESVHLLRAQRSEAYPGLPDPFDLQLRWVSQVYRLRHIDVPTVDTSLS
jgi:hypothetical protein